MVLCPQSLERSERPLCLPSCCGENMPREKEATRRQYTEVCQAESMGRTREPKASQRLQTTSALSQPSPRPYCQAGFSLQPASVAVPHAWQGRGPFVPSSCEVTWASPPGPLVAHPLARPAPSRARAGEGRKSGSCGHCLEPEKGRWAAKGGPGSKPGCVALSQSLNLSESQHPMCEPEP